MPKEGDIVESKKLVETGVLVKKLALLNEVCLSQANKLDKLEKMVFRVYGANPQETPVSSSEDEIDCSWYVVVTEKDGDENYEQISVRETFLRDSDLESAKLRVERYKEIGCYGNCRIARLVFLEEKK